MSDVTNLPLLIGSSIVSILACSGNKVCEKRGEQNPICTSMPLAFFLRIRSLNLFVVFNRSWVSLRRLHWFTNLTSYRPGFLFSACFLAFSFPRAQRTPSDAREERARKPPCAHFILLPFALPDRFGIFSIF